MNDFQSKQDIIGTTEYLYHKYVFCQQPIPDSIYTTQVPSQQSGQLICYVCNLDSNYHLLEWILVTTYSVWFAICNIFPGGGVSKIPLSNLLVCCLDWIHFLKTVFLLIHWCNTLVVWTVIGIVWTPGLWVHSWQFQLSY